MPEPFLERLTRFTPDAGELNRDLLLIAAGRASARPNRGWIGLAAALAGSHVLALVFLWPQSLPPGRGVPIAGGAPAPPSARVGVTSKTLAGSGVWSMRHDVDGPQIEDRPADALTLIDSGPPWRAFGPPPSSVLN